MKIGENEFKDIEKVKIKVYRCPYCHKILNNKNSYRVHLLKNSVCGILRDYNYDYVDNHDEVEELIWIKKN